MKRLQEAKTLLKKTNWETAPDDIYDSKDKYIKIRSNLEKYLEKPKGKKKGLGKRKYSITNPANLKYFYILLARKDSQGISYINRIKYFNYLLKICHYSEKDLAELTREDVDQIVSQLKSNIKTANELRNTITYIQHIAKIIIPDKDAQGRIDETITPYAFRHLKSSVDKSRNKKKEIPSLQDMQKVIQFFRQDIRTQAFIALAYESDVRPQELCYCKVKDFKKFDNYAKIYVSEHGKEGTKFLECLDSFPYVIKWYNEHPLREDPNAWLFVNLGDRNRHDQLKPHTINKHLRHACIKLGIPHMTCYDIKRAGITHQKLRGDSSEVIAHRAGISVERIKTYDYSKHEQSFKLHMIKTGRMKPEDVPEELKPFLPKNKRCGYCETNNGFADKICSTCKRPLFRDDIMAEEKRKEEEFNSLQKQISDLAERMELIGLAKKK